MSDSTAIEVGQTWYARIPTKSLTAIRVVSVVFNKADVWLVEQIPRSGETEMTAADIRTGYTLTEPDTDDE